MNVRKKYLMLFFSTLTISAFTFGGGYVIISLLKKKFSDELDWIEGKEMLNLAAIAQSSPGAVAVNAAILVGYRVAGIPGMLISIFGTIIPPFIIIMGISFCYASFRNSPVVSAVLKGMQSGISAVIADVTVNLFCNVRKESGWKGIVIMLVAFCASWCFSVNVLWVILACIAYGFMNTLIAQKKGRKSL